MRHKDTLKANILNFKLSSPNEICQELGQRLKIQRLFRNLKQSELAGRAGVSVGTVKNLESKGQSSLDSWIRIVVALDLVQDFQDLFTLRVQTIAQMEKMEKLMSPRVRKRAR